MIKKNTDKISNKISNDILKKKIKNKKDIFLKFIKNHYTNSFKILISYIMFVLIGASLLYLPISFNPGHEYLRSDGRVFDFLDSIFITSSAFSNTGLTTTDVSETFSPFGQTIIYLWIQLGGFGLLSTFYLIGKSFNKVFNKKIINNSLMYHAERGGTKISNTGKVLFSIFLINIFIQMIFSIIFTIIFYNLRFFSVSILPDNSWVETNELLPMYGNLGLSIWNGMFLTGSAINNAGFDLFGATSLAPFRNDIGILIQFFTMLLFISGGIGYVVIYDLWKKAEYSIYKLNPIAFEKYFKTNVAEFKLEKPRLSIFSKICLWSALIFGALSIGIVFSTEYILINSSNNSILGANHHSYFNQNYFNSNWAIIFNTLSTRSAGFATFDMNILSDVSKWLFIFFMFVGTSPASTGGGIRTTTFVVLLKSVFGKIIGSSDINIFKKRISKRTIVDSTNIFAASIIIVIFLTIIICLLSFDNRALVNNDITDFFFEASSAFGTTGLSTGVTMDLNDYAYFPLIILMFFGQLGIINSIQIFSNNKTQNQKISYSDIEIKLG